MSQLPTPILLNIVPTTFITAVLVNYTIVYILHKPLQFCY